MQKTTVPPLPLTGGCQCGRISYRMRANPVVFYLCHCTECQRHTSSAFGESLRFKREHLDVDPGLVSVSRMSESGNERQGWFCPDCGVRIWHGTSGSAEINIKAGTLDDTSWLVPAGHIWCRSRQPFMNISADELSYDTQPEDGYEALKQRWQEMTRSS
ncbi:GFA family protein [Hoeflea sp. AS16]|uniref:GFA family protein n=1 Tax=Hoeflea sp. AS16 TaxID=3135779 RepID=UPI00316F05FA